MPRSIDVRRLAQVVLASGGALDDLGAAPQRERRLGRLDALQPIDQGGRLADGELARPPVAGVSPNSCRAVRKSSWPAAASSDFRNAICLGEAGGPEVLTECHACSVVEGCDVVRGSATASRMMSAVTSTTGGPGVPQQTIVTLDLEGVLVPGDLDRRRRAHRHRGAAADHPRRARLRRADARSAGAPRASTG